MNSFYMDYKDSRLREFVGVRIDKDLHQKLKEEAQTQGTDLSNFIREVLKGAIQ